MKRRGNCYVASEALYHLLGGKAAGWKPMSVRTESDVHWFLKHESGLIVDVTAAQFDKGEAPDYTQARGRGFMTKRPSRRARSLMEKLVWQNG